VKVVIEKDLGWQDSDLNFDETAVMEKLLKLILDKSPGSDGIHPQLLCNCSSSLIPHHTLNVSLHRNICVQKIAILKE